jgi:hypothetical protein
MQHDARKCIQVSKIIIKYYSKALKSVVTEWKSLLRYAYKV